MLSPTAWNSIFNLWKSKLLSDIHLRTDLKNGKGTLFSSYQDYAFPYITEDICSPQIELQHSSPWGPERKVDQNGVPKIRGLQPRIVYHCPSRTSFWRLNAEGYWGQVLDLDPSRCWCSKILPAAGFESTTLWEPSSQDYFCAFCFRPARTAALLFIYIFILFNVDIQPFSYDRPALNVSIWGTFPAPAPWRCSVPKLFYSLLTPTDPFLLYLADLTLHYLRPLGISRPPGSKSYLGAKDSLVVLHPLDPSFASTPLQFPPHLLNHL